MRFSELHRQAYRQEGDTPFPPWPRSSFSIVRSGDVSGKEAFIMNKKKFDPRTFQGKNRVYSTVGNNLQRLWIWDGSRYEVPASGNPYYARRKRDDRYEYETFPSIVEAREWQSSSGSTNASVLVKPLEGPTFKEIVEDHRRRKFPSLASSTRDQYDKLLRLYFDPLMSKPILQITPAIVDEWIDWLKSDEAGFIRNPTRREFKHELRLLSTILNYYEEYSDDSAFRSPIKKRHREDVLLNRPRRASPRDITEAEFLKFREQLLQGPRGPLMSRLATIQFYHALRINEAAGLFWEDISFDQEVPSKSRLRVVRSVEWIRRRGMKSSFKTGFKNSDAIGGIKEQALQAETFKVLSEMKGETQEKNGPVFAEASEPLEYRWIQYAYDSAFEAAGLPYRGTHIMRHGGTRKVFNETGDLSIAGQLLGNTTTQSVQVYAKRNTNALNQHVETLWKRSRSLQIVAEDSEESPKSEVTKT